MKRKSVFIVAPVDYDPDPRMYPGTDALPQIYVVGRRKNCRKSYMDSYQQDDYEEIETCGSMSDAMKVAVNSGERKPRIL